MPESPHLADTTAAAEGRSYRLVLLLDHANVEASRFNLDSIVREWITTLGIASGFPTIVEVIVRAYGGWFEETISSRKRYEAHDFYQGHCPTLLRIDGRYFRVLFSFADDLLVSKTTLLDPGNVRVTHTVANRTSKKDFVVAKSAPACPDPACEIKNVQRWVRSDRACLKAACPRVFSATFVRKEQKQVDMHLAVDLIALAMGSLNRPNEGLCIGIASDDLDLIPAIATAMQLSYSMNTLTAIRFSPKRSYLDSSLISAGVFIATIP